MRSKLIGIAAIAAMLFPAAAAADPGESTHVDSIEASASGNFITVSGAASFVSEPIDPVDFEGTGDSLEPGIGADVTGAEMSRAVGSNNGLFTIEVGDMPGGMTSAPGVVYIWGLSVNGTDSGYFLMASTGGGIPVPCTTPTCGSLMQNQADGFSTVQRLSTTISNGKVTWTVPLSRIGAKTGDTIGVGGGGAPTGSINGANEIVYCCTQVDGLAIEEFTMPGAQVQLGIASSDTPDDQVPLTISASSVNATTGAFNGVLPAPGEAGDYKVVAKACYSTGNCGLSSTTITV